MRSSPVRLPLLLGLLAVSCATDEVPEETFPVDARTVDAPRPADAAPRADAPPRFDAAPRFDAPPPVDAALPDAACADQGDEPNDTEATAHDEGAIDDCDGSAATIAGVLTGATDADWFRLAASDVFGCSVNPSVQATFATPARVCMYTSCPGGDATVTCPAGTVGDVSPGGLAGCCGLTGFDMDIACPGTDDSTTMYLRVDAADECLPYTLVFHY